MISNKLPPQPLSRTERRKLPAMTLWGALAGVCFLLGFLRILSGSSLRIVVWLWVIGLCMLVVWAVAPKWFLRPALAVHWVLQRVGDVVSGVILTVIYL